MTRGTLDLGKRLDWTIVSVADESIRSVHIGSMRIEGPLILLHENQGSDPECCGTERARIVIEPLRNVEHIDVYGSLAELKAALVGDGIVLVDHDDDSDPRPEIR